MVVNTTASARAIVMLGVVAMLGMCAVLTILGGLILLDTLEASELLSTLSRFGR
jgi:hypothetical protein